MANFEEKIYGNMTFGKLLKEIHEKTNQKEQLIMDVINQLKDMCNNLQDALLLLEPIKAYMTLSIQTNDQLIKMAAIVQKAIDRSSSGEGDVLLTDEEKANLLLLAGAEEAIKNEKSLPKA